MALTKSTAGNRLILHDNVLPRVPSAAYISAGITKGDLVKNSSTGNAVDHCANNDVPVGVVISDMYSPTAISIARLTPNVQIILDYTGSVTVGDKVVSTGARGTVITSFDSVKTDNSNGTGNIIAKDAAAAGTGTCVVQY